MVPGETENRSEMESWTMAGFTRLVTLRLGAKLSYGSLLTSTQLSRILLFSGANSHTVNLGLWGP